MRPGLLLTLIFWGIRMVAACQDISFSNINTSNGLSDNFIRSLAVDKNGFLWIGTNEGLNIYDGYSVTNISREENPDIPSKAIIHLYCDRQNNIWLGSAEGAAWADDKRHFHRVKLEDSITNFYCSTVCETRTLGILLFTDRGEFAYSKKDRQWKRIKSPSFLPRPEKMVEVMNYSDDRLLFATLGGVYLYDYRQEKIIYSHPFAELASITPYHDNIIAVADNRNKVYLLDMNTDKVSRQFDLSKACGALPSTTEWIELRRAADGNLVCASIRLGFFIIDKEGKITHYTHQPTNNNSIAGDKALRVLGTADGTVVVGTERYGLSIFNILKKQAGYKKFFVDSKGNFFDGYLTEIAMDKDGSYWIGGSDRLVHWNRQTDQTEFFQADMADSSTGIRHPDFLRTCIDKRGQIWLSVPFYGIALFDRSNGKFNLIKKDSSLGPSVKSNFISDLFEWDGSIWAGTFSGFYTIDPVSKKINTIEKHPLLGPLARFRVDCFTSDSKGRLWISTRGHGIYCYDKANNSLKQFTSVNGLIDDQCIDIYCDSHDNIYISHFTGFSIICTDGRIKTYTKNNGLRYDKADAFVEDSEGRIWISNAKCLARLDPSTGRIDIYDEHENLNNGGFKPSSAFRTPEGELLWGTQSGLNYFFPQQLKIVPEPLQVSIYKVLSGDSTYTSNLPARKIKYKYNNIQFYFVAINLHGSRNIRYQYRLQGYDKTWQEGTDIREARYSSLPPGDYVFRVRASADRIHWTDAGSEFYLRIVAPLYMRGWFKAVLVLLATTILIYFWRRRTLQLQQKKEELETEQAINYFASSMHEQQTVEEILWDVARNCIGRLQFEDCVIYLVDEKSNSLVQKAAHGPKSPRNFEITQPINIPMGKGIVGSVAQTGKAEIVSDTTRDPRYIVDDEARNSEITVPILSNGRVLGVIDCEHSRKRFFTQKHLSILSTIASLCAIKIIRAKTEQDKKQTEIMLAETRQKMTEAEMQALRAQMNPHFIFNCLNSINRYIVKSDQATASLYLTRFAKLIRLILDNSNSKNVILSNELEALKLYVEMESLRFDNVFNFIIEVDPSVQTDSIEIPPLIIQPYVENAIWHGLLHKGNGGTLKLHISKPAPGLLQCEIEDNGVGRQKAMELKSKTATSKKSLGMELTENRLLLLNQYAQVHSSVNIIDLFNDRSEPAGTKVVIQIPVG